MTTDRQRPRQRIRRSGSPRPAPLVLVSTLAALVAAAGCANNPEYIAPRRALEYKPSGGQQQGPVTDSFTLPIRRESQTERDARRALANTLGVKVPYVRRDDMDIEIEWTVKNLANKDGQATIKVNGANEWFSYVPADFVFNPEKDETPPPLMGGIPLAVPADTTITGVFREDQSREAAIALELITRGGQNAFAALLQNHADTAQFTNTKGKTVPSKVFAGLVRFDISFTADQHMVMEYAIRVRDHRGLLAPDLTATPASKLTSFSPTEYKPPPPPPMQP